MKNCKSCNKEKELSEFYKNGTHKSGKVKYKPTCKSCENDLRKSFVNEKIKYVIENYGNSCVICGYNKCFAALDFHHTDPTIKEYEVGSLIGNFTPLSTLITELEKCVILCSNCHREVHAGITSIK